MRTNPDQSTPVQQNESLSQRLLPEDLFRLEAIGESQFSADGAWLAFEKHRAADTGPTHPLSTWYYSRSEIYLLAADGSHCKQITDGKRDGLSYYGPQWSPSSRYLAFLGATEACCRGYVWDTLTRELKLASDRPVHTWFRGVGMQWISEHEILIITCPEGLVISHAQAESRPGRKAMEGWPRAWTGQDVTAVQLESGLSEPLPQRDEAGCGIEVVDLRSGTSQFIETGLVTDVVVSPKKAVYTCFKVSNEVPPVMPSARERQYNIEIDVTRGSSLHLGYLMNDGVSGVSKPQVVSEVKCPLPSTLQWSSNSRECAVMGRAVEEGTPDRLYRINSETQQVNIIEHQNLAICKYVWAGSVLLVQAKRRDGSGGDAETVERLDWWRVENNESWVNLTRDYQDTFPELHPDLDPSSMIGCAGGSLWRIPLDSTPATKFVKSEDLQFVSIEAVFGPDKSIPDEGIISGNEKSASHSVASFYSTISLAAWAAKADEPPERVWVQIDRDKVKINSLPRTEAHSTVKAYSAAKRAIAYASHGTERTRLWIAAAVDEPVISHNVSNDNRDSPTSSFSTNEWLKNKIQGEVKKIEYEGPEGKPLIGWVILPIEHDGKPCPLITVPYAGRVYSDAEPRHSTILEPTFLAEQLLAARGYAVLLPSIPLPPISKGAERYHVIPEGVHAAIDKIIQIGIADENRLGVMGHSYGGYSSYSLITHSNRFKAAISLAGMSNLISRYGSGDARSRYCNFAHPQSHMWIRAWLMEQGQGGMGCTPWEDIDRYIRNSPIRYVDQIQTPLLIVHGDFDYVNVQQGEEMFTALYRQGKRARMLQYLGEGHCIEGKMNILHLWENIYDWFDTYLV